MCDTSVKVVRALTALKQPTYYLLVYLLVIKLDSETHRIWENSLDRSSSPTFVQLTYFLDRRWQRLKIVHSFKDTMNKELNIETKSKQLNTYSHFAGPRKSQCPCWKKDHVISQCTQFYNFDYTAKIKARSKQIYLRGIRVVQTIILVSQV